MDFQRVSTNFWDILVDNSRGIIGKTSELHSIVQKVTHIQDMVMPKLLQMNRIGYDKVYYILANYCEIVSQLIQPYLLTRVEPRDYIELEMELVQCRDMCQCHLYGIYRELHLETLYEWLCVEEINGMLSGTGL